MISNLERFELRDDEAEVLNFCLKRGVKTQRIRNGSSNGITFGNKLATITFLKENRMAKQRVQTALRAFTYNYLGLESKDYHLERKQMNIVQNLTEKFMILEPDKGQGIVLVNKDDYIRNIECLFSDKTKFQLLDKDANLQSLNTIQNYLNILFMV